MEVNIDTMANVQTNAIDAGLLRDINYISGDKSLMRRLARYVGRLVREKTDDPTLMTKEEFFRMIDESKEQARQGKVKTFDNMDDMNQWLNSL